MQAFDPTYADDFWSKPGSLGMEETALDGFVRAARIDHVATIAEVSRDTGVAPTSLVLDGVPPIDIAVPLEYTVYPADGTTTATRCRGGPAQKRPKQTLHVQARHTLCQAGHLLHGAARDLPTRG